MRYRLVAIGEGRCAEYGCRSPPASNRKYCARHLAAGAKRAAKSQEANHDYRINYIREWKHSVVLAQTHFRDGSNTVRRRNRDAGV